MAKHRHRIHHMDQANTPSRKLAAGIQMASGMAISTIAIIQGLILVPLYLKYIGAQVYGLWLASGGILGMMWIVNFGISNLVGQRVASQYGAKSLDGVFLYFFNGLIIYILISILYIILGGIVELLLPDLLKLDSTNSAVIIRSFQIALVAAVFTIINECLRVLSQSLMRPLIPMLGIILGRVCGILLSIWLLIENFGLIALPLATLFSEVMIFIINIAHTIHLIKKLKIPTSAKFSKIHFLEYMKLGPPLTLAKLGSTFSQESEPVFITAILGPETNAAYMICKRAADIVSQILSIICGSIHSPFSHLFAVDPNKAYKVAEKVIVVVFTLGSVGYSTYIALNDYFIHLWVGKQYWLHQSIIILIGIGLFQRSVRDILWHILNGMGGFLFSSHVILVDGLIRIGLMYFLIKQCGLIGAPIALIVSSSISFGLLARKFGKYNDLNQHANLYWLILFSTISLLLLNTKIESLILLDSSWLRFAIIAATTSLLNLLVITLINKRLLMKISLTR